MRIPGRQAALDARASEYLAAPESGPKGNGRHTFTALSRGDDEVIEKLRSQSNGKFDRLWRGDLSLYGNDHSKADDAFVHKVWSYTQDEEQVRRIHALSALHRHKSARRPDYLKRSINRARNQVTWFYDWSKGGTRVGPEEKRGKEPEEEGQEVPTPFKRADLAGALERGVDPPAVLVDEVMFSAKVHSVYSAGGTGKTFYAAYLARRVLEKGGVVLYFDQENGLRIISERAKCLGITPEQAKRLYYFPFPAMPLDAEVVRAFEHLLDELRPDLVVFDSWVNFLAMCGLDENSSGDVATWTEAYPQKARHRNIAVLILDHVPKEGGSARGSGRKLDYVDVMWELRNPQPFDRQTVGRIDLHLRKDREGWLPRTLTYSVGGNEDGFVFERSLRGVRTHDDAGMSKSAATTLEALKSLGTMGASDKEWCKETAARGISRATYYRSRKALLEAGFVGKDMTKFFVVKSNNAETMSRELSSESHETNETLPNGWSQESRSLRCETPETTQADTAVTGTLVDKDFCSHGTPLGYFCDDCDIDARCGGGE